MALQIRYISECSCGGTFTTRELHLDQDGTGGEVVIDLDIFGAFTMECDNCTDKVWVPAMSDMIEDIE